MMNAVGIIAEYNPFHNGHRFHLEEAKRIAGDNAVVVVMSGNYVQRGEPAILNKWDRARLAVENGADLVIEIPALFSLGNAKQYSDASIMLLESLGVINTFVFGSESGNIAAIDRVAQDLLEKRVEINEYIQSFTKEGYSYPRARYEAYKRIFPFNSNAEILNNSNDSLAVEYILSNSSMRPSAIKRTNDYSASYIRDAILSNLDIVDMVPTNTKTLLKNSIITNVENWFQTLKYAILRMTSEEIDDCPSGGEGLGNRLKSQINNANSWSDFIQLIKSKRYTYTRLSRLCMQIILGISRSKYSFDHPEYLRILATNTKGRELLSNIQDNELNKLPIVSNISKQRELLNDDALILLELDAHASDVYNLVTGRNVASMSDYRVPPIIIE